MEGELKAQKIALVVGLLLLSGLGAWGLKSTFERRAEEAQRHRAEEEFHKAALEALTALGAAEQDMRQGEFIKARWTLDNVANERLQRFQGSPAPDPVKKLSIAQHLVIYHVTLEACQAGIGDRNACLAKAASLGEAARRELNTQR